MPIQYKTGDIFNTTAKCLVNPVNMVGSMGAGLALQFKKKYPEMHLNYQAFCELNGLKNGIIVRDHLEYINGGTDVDRVLYLHEFIYNNGITIINAPTKDHWKDPSNMEIVKTTIYHLSVYFKVRGIQRAAVPRLGCGLGRLSWKEVLIEMKRNFIPINTIVEIWSLPGEK